MNIIETVEDGSGNIISQVISNNDGTGVRTTYLPDGSADTVEQLTNLPIDQPISSDPLADLQAQIAKQQKIIDSLIKKLDDTTNT